MVPPAPTLPGLLLAGLCCCGGAAFGQGLPARAAAEPGAADAAPPAGADALPLRAAPALREDLSPALRSTRPTFVRGDRLLGRTEQELLLDGNAEVRRGDMVIRAERLEYDQATDRARARGQVRVQRDGNVYSGPYLELKVDAFEGFFTQPDYRLLRNNAYGSAQRIDFLGEKRAVIRNASYTTCQRQPAPGWSPDWVMQAEQVKVDLDEDSGEASGAVLRFKGVPLLMLPTLSFPLSDTRKSGLLPPTYSVDNISGLTLVQPWYWNIAPNRDATFYPTLLARRGAQLGGEFRYLEPQYRGQLRADLMPEDKLRGSSRWAYSLQHSGVVADSLFGTGGPLALGINANRVSDDNYWRDFPRALPSLTQRLLPLDARGSLNLGGWAVSARSLSWQVLQDAASPITPPYDRVPQLSLRQAREGLWGGFDLALEADTTRFRSVSALTLQPNGQRNLAVAVLSRPWLRPEGFVVPRLQLHATQYSLDTPLADGRLSATRALPTLSLDAGLVFERDAAYLGRAFRQSLEPRAFYVYTPYRNQSALPNYDSGANDFSFATVFTENAFGGSDRIADNNLLTLGAVSRLLDTQTGAEAARVGFAQRLRFADQRVSLPGVATLGERLSDLLLGASLNFDPRWSADATIQYNPDTRTSIRNTLLARYSPAPLRVVSAAYRIQRGQSEQLDLGWQWPLGQPFGEGARWYSVGRLNYSLQDRRPVDALLGLELEADCWVGRAVFERVQSTLSAANKRLLFQLEFSGFSRLGTNALQSLKQNIPRYQVLREQVTVPSRFSNYD